MINQNIALELYCSKNKDIVKKYPHISRFLTQPYNNGWLAKLTFGGDDHHIVISLLDKLQLYEMITLMLEFRSLKDYNMSDIIRDYISELGDVGTQVEDLGDQVVINATFEGKVRVLQRNGIKWLECPVVQKRLKPCPEKYSGVNWNAEVYKELLE